VTEVQFFKESGIAADDIDGKGGRRRMNDLDELELEERERVAKKKLSQKFVNFAKLVDFSMVDSWTPRSVNKSISDRFSNFFRKEAIVKQGYSPGFDGRAYTASFLAHRSY